MLEYNYNIVYDLDQSLATIPTLKVIQTFLMHLKALIFFLGVIDPSNSYLIMTFDINNSK